MDKVFDKWTFARFQKVLSLAFGVCMLSLALTACGDSSDDVAGGSAEEEGIIASETFDELPKCTEEREGVTAYVKKDKAGYVCKDGDWVPDIAEESSDSDEEVSSSSYSGEGDSESSASDNDISSSSQTKREIIVINDKSITGVSQKGPFVTGSAVKLYELDGKSLAQTGKSFTGKISSDKGEFSVSSVSLSSQYALLEASGYYRNEVTGNKSSGTIVLNALTDLSDREKVNINLLTHLEYERAIYLVNKGMPVAEAKKQAEQEVFAAFGIEGNFGNSEDLSIFSDAALLAFSVLMLGDNSDADLTELMNKFATDIKEDGEWNNEVAKAKIADWASARDLNGNLKTIKSNVNDWNLGIAPDFEKYVRNFWYRNYKLGDCDKSREGEVAADSNANSANYYKNSQIRYICKSGVWVEASEVELVLGGCTETREADISLNTGKVNNVRYVCKEREWKVSGEQSLGGDGGTVYFPASKNPESVVNFYNNWMAKFYVTFGEEVSSADEEYYSAHLLPLLRQSARIKYDQPDYTVSNGIGYGMLAAVFQGDQARFNALMNYYLAFRCSPDAGGYYMKWKIFGFEIGMSGSSVSDADLDIAASLFIAHEKWGSAVVNYLQYGIEEAFSIFRDEVNSASHLIVPANEGAMLSTGAVYSISYFSLVAIKLFSMYDTERAAQWNEVLESTIAYMQKVQDAGNGLWPDWSDINGTPTDPQNGSSTGKFNDYWGLEGVRIPWRLVWYYSWFGDDRVKAMIQKAAAFATTITGGDVGMTLNRYAYQDEFQASTVVGGNVSHKGAFCALGMIDPMYADYLSNCNSVILSTALSDGTNYFAPSIQLLYLQLMNGIMTR